MNSLGINYAEKRRKKERLKFRSPVWNDQSDQDLNILLISRYMTLNRCWVNVGNIDPMLTYRNLSAEHWTLIQRHTSVWLQRGWSHIDIKPWACTLSCARTLVDSTCVPASRVVDSYALSEDYDQTVHSHSLIRIFTWRFLDRHGCKVSTWDPTPCSCRVAIIYWRCGFDRIRLNTRNRIKPWPWNTFRLKTQQFCSS